MGFLLLLPPSPGMAQQKPVKAAGGLGSSIGDVHFSHYRRIDTNLLHLADITFVGPGVVIEPRDANRPTQFRLVADTVSGHKVKAGNRSFARVELEGNLHYTLTRHIRGETQTVEGTAGSAVYDQEAGVIRLNGGVAATLTDPVGLEKPGRLRAGRAILPIQTGREYLLSGTPEQNDLAFTPRRPTEKKTVNGKIEKTPSVPSGFAGPIHLSHFRTGSLLPNRTAHVEGLDTLLEISNSATEGADVLPHTASFARQKGRIMAASLTVGYTPGARRYEGQGNVRFHLMQEDSAGAPQSVTGRSDSVAYDGAEERLTLNGAVEASLDDPAALMHPARLRAERAVMLRLPSTGGKDGKANPTVYRYTLEGDAARALLEFQPRPRLVPGSADKPSPPTTTADLKMAQAITTGRVEITRFIHGEFVPGRDVEFTGNGVTFATNDPDKRSSARIEGARLAGRFADNRTLNRMNAVGKVRFAIVQPAGETRQMQNIAGSGSEVDFAVAPAEQIVTLQGPLEVRVDSPVIDSPALITDTDRRGRIIYNLTHSQLQQDSPGGTGRIRFVPRARKTVPTTKGTGNRPEKPTAEKPGMAKQKPQQQGKRAL